jgi:hypothetical protein
MTAAEPVRVEPVSRTVPGRSKNELDYIQEPLDGPPTTHLPICQFLDRWPASHVASPKMQRS